jgi:CzcA family heavy metal efflux pump
VTSKAIAAERTELTGTSRDIRSTMRRLIEFCLTYRFVVLLLAGGVLVWGAEAARRAPWDVFPEFAPPQVVVQAEAGGLSSEEVEQLVTVPVESALNGLSGIDVLRSSSAQGLSVVTVIFKPGTDIFTARQQVSERLVEVTPQLPSMAEPPRLTPLKASTSRLLMLGLTSQRVSLVELRTLGEWTLRRRLLAVPGVAQVEVFGGDLKQYQIIVDGQRLQQYDITLDEVVAAAREATGFGGAGFVENDNQRLPIRQRSQIRSALDLAEVPVVFQDGVPLTLGRVADVRLGPALKSGDATIDGRPGVLLVVHKQPSANTLETTLGVETALAELSSALPDGVALRTTLFRQASFIERAIGNLNVSILVGCVLVTLVLIAFLLQWRTVVISLTAIPLSLLGAVAVLHACGASLNTMTLGGLAIALGAVVDDAIVDVENVLRRLRENRQQADPASTFSVVLEASLEVRSAIVYASLIVVLVFLPVFFLEGIAGTFFRSMGAAYVAAICTSLIVAMTVTPAMCLWLMSNLEERRRRLQGGPGPTALGRPASTLGRLYAGVLPLFLGFPVATTLLAATAFIAAAAASPFLGGEFLPEFREANFVVFMAGKPDASLPETTRMGSIVAERLLTVPGVASVAQQAGRADLSEDTWGTNISEIWVALDGRADYNRVRREVRKSLDDLAGFDFEIKPFLRERVDEVLTGTTADIVIRVVGPDLRQLRAAANRIAAALRDVHGIADLRVEQVVDVPQVDILLRPADVARYGLSIGYLNRTLQTLLQGVTVGQVHEQDRVFDVVVQADPVLRTQPANVRELLIDLPPHERTNTESTTFAVWPPPSQRTEKIPLRALADIQVTAGPNLVNREGGERRILVTCNAEGRDVAGVMRDIQERTGQLTELPPYYHLEFGGEYQARQAAMRQLVLLSAAVLCGIFILLYLDFQNLRLTLLVMLSVPLACVGGVAAMFLSGGEASLGSLVGLVTVFGIAVRNGILLISHYEHLQHEEGMEFGRDLIIRGATERLAPILMTALTTALALLPLVLLGDQPGHEIEHPMAVVITGGLISSTFLSLVLLPVLHQWTGRVATAES